MNHLSETQCYVISTHLTLYLWLGKNLEMQIKQQSLRILKAF